MSLEPILITERLYLREFVISDAEFYFELNNDPRVIQYTGDLPFASLEATREFLKNYDAYSRTGFGRWAVLDAENHSILGWCGLKRLADGYVDLGYRFPVKYWGKGFATESGRACLRLGFEKYHLDEIIGRSDRRNLASIRVLEKCGMKFWKHDACEGIEDSVIYKIHSSDLIPSKA